MIKELIHHYGWQIETVERLTLGQFYYYSDLQEQDMVITTDKKASADAQRTSEIIKAYAKAHPESNGTGDWFGEIMPWWRLHGGK